MYYSLNDTQTSHIHILSLHDALPISMSTSRRSIPPFAFMAWTTSNWPACITLRPIACRSEEHTSELQSLRHLVCRLLLEKKKKKTRTKPALLSEKQYKNRLTH